MARIIELRDPMLSSRGKSLTNEVACATRHTAGRDTPLHRYGETLVPLMLRLASHH